MKIAVIVGSLRAKSFNRSLFEMAKGLAPEGVELVELDFSAVPFFNQDLENPAPEAVSKVRAELAEADGLWIFSPEYNHAIPGVVKNLLDWLSRPQGGGKGPVLARKKVTYSGAALGIAGTISMQDDLVKLLSLCNMNLMNAPRVTIPSAMTLLDTDARFIGDERTRAALQKQMTAFVAFIQGA